MKKLFGKAWNFLQSRTLALVLLALVVAGVVLAQLFGLAVVTSSWGFLLVVILLGLNTLACSVARTGILVARAREVRETGLSSPSHLEPVNHTEIETPLSLSRTLTAVVKVLRREGYRVKTGLPADSGATPMLAQKGLYGEWGSVIFHFGMVAALLGILCSHLYRFEGVMVITEGQTVSEWRQDYLAVTRVPPAGETHSGFQLMLNELRPTYLEGKTGIDYAANLTVLEYGRVLRNTVLRVNQPLVEQGTTFLLERYGFAPLFILSNGEGKEVFNSFVNLRVIGENAEDSFTIPGTAIEISVRFYPDVISVGGELSTRSLLPENPAMYLVVTENSSEVFRGLVTEESPAELGELMLAFDEIRYWTQYKVVRDPVGQAIIFSAFWLGAAGMVLRYLFIQKKLWITAAKQDGKIRLSISGVARQFNWLYSAEFIKIVERLKKETHNGSG